MKPVTQVEVREVFVPHTIEPRPPVTDGHGNVLALVEVETPQHIRLEVVVPPATFTEREEQS